MALSMFKKKQYVGLDLGTSTIAAAQMERSGQVWKITRYGKVPTPPEAIQDGAVLDVEAVALGIRQVMTEAGITANSAVIGAAGSNVIVRTLRIAKMNADALRKSIRFEAGRYVPSSVEDSFIEFEILGEVEDEGTMDVLIVAAPREAVASRIEACNQAGLEVEVVDIEAFAMHRALVETGSDESMKTGTIALVDVGATTTNVSVVDNGSFALTRSIPHAGQNVTDALKKGFKLDEDKAEEGKRQLDFELLMDDDAPVENPPLRVAQSPVDELVREVRRSLNYFQSQQTEAGSTETVSRVVLSGGGSEMRGLAPYFESKLGIPVSCIGVFDNPRVLLDGSEQGHGMDLTVASGLAMRAQVA
jgi:type IV pilus assembly protein PilM